MGNENIANVRQRALDWWEGLDYMEKTIVINRTKSRSITIHDEITKEQAFFLYQDINVA